MDSPSLPTSASSAAPPAAAHDGDGAARAVAVGAIAAALAVALMRARGHRRAAVAVAADVRDARGSALDVANEVSDNLTFDEAIALAPTRLATLQREPSLKELLDSVRQRSDSESPKMHRGDSGGGGGSGNSVSRLLAVQPMTVKRTVSGFSGLAFGDPGNTPSANAALRVFFMLATEQDGTRTITHDAFVKALLDELRLNLSRVCLSARSCIRSSSQRKRRIH
jgi:hypothetical protein